LLFQVIDNGFGDFPEISVSKADGEAYYFPAMWRIMRCPRREPDFPFLVRFNHHGTAFPNFPSPWSPQLREGFSRKIRVVIDSSLKSYDVAPKNLMTVRIRAYPVRV
jgi:hypothetical protein